MPTITYHRFWCKNCNDWTLFHAEFKAASTMECKTCNHPEEKIVYGDIPKEKILEQRNRYKDSNEKRMAKITSSYLTGFMQSNSFLHNFNPEIVINEHDAGQKKIDSINIERRMAEIKRNKQERIELKMKYNGLGRNDKCGCGSGKKFKKCCQLKTRTQ